MLQLRVRRIDNWDGTALDEIPEYAKSQEE
jgi:hypothetical protein